MSGGLVLGDLDGPVAWVDSAGAVAPLGKDWQVAWAVGSSQRWHVAADEAAVRSGCVDDTPVALTAMRVHGGDVTATAAAVRAESKRVVVIEFANHTPEPVSLAVAVKPCVGDTPSPADFRSGARRGSGSRSRRGRAGPLSVRGRQVLMNGRPAIETDREPSRVVAAHHAHVWAALGDVSDVPDASPHGHMDARSVVLVMPLVVGAVRAVTVHLDPPAPTTRRNRLARRRQRGANAGSHEPDEPTAAPLSPAAAVGGWNAVLGRAARIDLGDESAQGHWREGIAAAILLAGDEGLDMDEGVPLLLDRVGLAGEADRARTTLLHALSAGSPKPSLAVRALAALASRRLRAGRDSGLSDWAGPLTAAAGDLLDHRTVAEVAAALAYEDPPAAADAVGLLETLSPPEPANGSQRGSAGLPETFAGESGSPVTPGEAPAPSAVACSPRQSASMPRNADGRPAGSAPEPCPTPRAAVVRALEARVVMLRQLLDAVVTESCDTLVLAPGLQAQWQQAPLDVRGVQTRHGELSYSVRRHGNRPALLWELRPHGDAPHSVVNIKCGLDPDWSTDDNTGEALLSHPQ